MPENYFLFHGALFNSYCPQGVTHPLGKCLVHGPTQEHQTSRSTRTNEKMFLARSFCFPMTKGRMSHDFKSEPCQILVREQPQTQCTRGLQKVFITCVICLIYKVNLSLRGRDVPADVLLSSPRTPDDLAQNLFLCNIRATKRLLTVCSYGVPGQIEASIQANSGLV